MVLLVLVSIFYYAYYYKLSKSVYEVQHDKTEIVKESSFYTVRMLYYYFSLLYLTN